MKANPAITALSAQINHASSPQQMKIAIRAAYARISNGQLLETTT